MILSLSMACLMGCSGITSAGAHPPAQVNPLQITTASLPLGTVSANYKATLSAAGGVLPYTWNVVSGQIPIGLTLSPSTGAIAGAPTQAGSFSFTAQVKDSKSAVVSGSVSLNIAAANSPLQITTTILPVGTMNSNYSATLSAAGGVPPYSWTTIAGQLPTGTMLSSSSGTISGTPTQAGSFSFTANVTDSKSASAAIGLSANISTASAATISTVSPNSGSTAGGTAVTISGTNFQQGATVQFGAAPATAVQVNSSTQIQATTPAEPAASVNVSVQEPDGQVATDASAFTFATPTSSGPVLPALPRATVDTTFPNTSAYTVTNVTPGQLQAALNAASCNPNGTILQLPQGSVDNESITMPVKSCATGQWIIVETAGLTLPSRGQRLDPSQFVGKMAKITQSQTNVYAVQTAPNAPSNHYWFLGLEVEHTGTDQGPVFDVGIPTNSPANFPSYIIIDHCYIHGRATNQISRTVDINGSNIAVVDSYLSENHEVGFDAQAVTGYSAPGPILIQNNFLEASTENVIFGGSGIATNLAPYNQLVDDLTIRGNYLYKPMAWRVGDPSYMGIHWEIKNLLEIKDGVRVLIENNVLENNWADAQTGDAVLFTPTQQSGPATVLQDVTFRNNFIAHASGGFQVTGRDATAPGDTMHRTDRILIQNNLLDDLKQSEWSGAGEFLEVSLGVNALTVNHNTVSWIDKSLMSINNDFPETAFSFTNNLVPTGNYGFFVANGTPNGVSGLNQWLSNPTIANNVLAGFPSATCSSFFTGAQCPASLASVGFVNYNNGSNGDYRLCAGSGAPAGSCGGPSPYAAGQQLACSSNTNCGADTAGIMSNAAGVAVLPSQLPSISSVTPANAACNATNTVTLTGQNFLPGTQVVVAGQLATTTINSTTQLTVTLPSLASGTYNLAVDNFGIPVTTPFACN